MFSEAAGKPKVNSNDFVTKIKNLMSHDNEILTFIRSEEQGETNETASIKVSEKTKIIIQLIQRS